MRSASRRTTKAPQAQRSAVMSYPSPVGGWNARDALAAMKPTDAVALDNWMPQPSYCEIRGGYTDYATGTTGNIKTLSVYNGLDGANKMFGLTNAGVWDVSSAGAVGSSVASRTDGKHQQVMFGDGTNNYLILVNGIDKPLYYDGTNWIEVDAGSSPALTGLTTTEIIGVNVFKGRLFFIQKSSLSFWYLDAGVAGGSLTEFDLSGEAMRGGYLMAVATWTRDAGDGQDDVIVFITSEGVAIVYQGDNPSNSNAWSKIGSYFIGRPIGRRCVRQYGGDVIVLVETGAFPLSAALQSASIDYTVALSFKIERAFTDAARIYQTNFGWEADLYPAQNALIVNIPQSEDGTHVQYVMNTITKAWCQFIGWDAETFAVFNGELFFSTGTKTVKAWTGQVDGVDNIEAYGKSAFSYYGSQGQQKQFKMFRPVLAVNGPLSFLTDIDVDFQDHPITGTATYNVTSGAQFDVSNWDQSFWAAGLEIVKEWTSPAEWQGYCASGKIKIATNTLQIQWLSSDMVYERGGIL